MQGAGESLALADLYGALGSEVRFAMIVDACQDDAAFESLVRSRGFVLLPETGQLDYLGDDVMHDLSAVSDDIRAAGAAEYLRAENPIILSAKPGVRARARKHPLWAWAPPVGPLADRLWNARIQRELTQSRSSLCEVLQTVVDLKQGVGEISMTGSVSWSDFSACASSVIVPPLTEERLVITHRWNVGELVSDFVITDDSFLVLDGKFRLLRVPRDGASPSVLLDDVAASNLRLAAGVPYWVTNQHELVRYVGKHGENVVGAGDLSFVGQGTGNSVLGIGRDAMVDTRDPMWRLHHGELQPIGTDAFLDGISDVVEWTPEHFYLTSTETNEIRLLHDKRISVVATVDRPAWLASTADYLYALAENRISMYRLDRSGCVSTLDLAALMRTENLTQSTWSTRAFVANDDASFMVGFGQEIVAFTVPARAWNACSN